MRSPYVVPSDHGAVCGVGAEVHPKKCSQGVATGWTTSRTSCLGFSLAIRTAIPDLVEWAWAASMAGWLAQGLSAESACSGSS
jgi:hypothetical protein